MEYTIRVFFLLIATVGNFFCATSAMDRKELALRYAVRHEIVPVLALDDYIIDVANAYCALKKEAQLLYYATRKVHISSDLSCIKINKKKQVLLNNEVPLLNLPCIQHEERIFIGDSISGHDMNDYDTAVSFEDNSLAIVGYNCALGLILITILWTTSVYL